MANDRWVVRETGVSGEAMLTDGVMLVHEIWRRVGPPFSSNLYLLPYDSPRPPPAESIVSSALV
jgi:hypothetical protein